MLHDSNKLFQRTPKQINQQPLPRETRSSNTCALQVICVVFCGLRKMKNISPQAQHFLLVAHTQLLAPAPSLVRHVKQKQVRRLSKVAWEVVLCPKQKSNMYTSQYTLDFHDMPFIEKTTLVSISQHHRYVLDRAIPRHDPALVKSVPVAGTE